MTNIGAIKVQEKQKDGPSKEYLVFVADGMSSILDYRWKQDSSQKLHRVDNFLIMGTGSTYHIRDVAEKLSSMKFSSAKQLADKVLELTKDFAYAKDSGLNFILGGMDESGLALYHVIAAGTYTDREGKPIQSNGTISPITDSFFDGSGSEYVRNYVYGCDAAGKPLRADDLADGLILAYDFGKKGAADAGVNDKLQYGIISDKGLSTLFHPDIGLLTYDAYSQYIKDMTGGEFPAIPNHKELGPEDIIIRKKQHDLERVLRNVYISFESDLSEYSALRNRFTRHAEIFANDKMSIDELTITKNERSEAKSHVAAGANALIQRGLPALLDYKHGFDQRQIEIENRALGYTQK